MRLFDWLLAISKIGYRLTRKEIPDVVKGLLDEAKKDGYIIADDKRFIDNKPSKNLVFMVLAMT